MLGGDPTKGQVDAGAVDPGGAITGKDTVERDEYGHITPYGVEQARGDKPRFEDPKPWGFTATTEIENKPPAPPSLADLQADMARGFVDEMERGRINRRLRRSSGRGAFFLGDE